jgi:hypothetical protein
LNRIILIITVFLLVLQSCKKEEFRQVNISGNQAPPDSTISSLTKENYVNKVYISLLGRKPTSAEASSGLAILNKNSLSTANRNELVDEVIAKPGYNQRLYEIASLDLLESNDTAIITERIYVYLFLLTDSTYASIWDLLNFEISRLQPLKTIPADLNSGTLDVIGMHRRLVNNTFYDEINMGTENFVVSMFQHFMDRYPTSAELEEGTKIVDGLTGVLFFQTGNSKDNFMDIMFDTDNYFESQVRELYLRYLFREPTSKEMTDLAISYKSDKNYKSLQKTILSLDEYVGL